MERFFEKRSPVLLNFILICQDFVSPSTLRLYLESKACTVVQQDDTIVGIGTTKPYLISNDVPRREYSSNPFPTQNEVAIHAYMRTPATWRPGLPSTPHSTDNPMSAYSAMAHNRGEDKEENLCVVFIKAINISNALSLNAYHFYEEALSYVRGAYLRHERHVAATGPIPVQEEAKPLKESFHLTAREHQILKWVSEGKGCWETGAILGISERTVKFHLQNIYRKLNVVNRAQAITKAMRYSLI